MARIATISPVWGCSVDDLRNLAKEAENGAFEAILSPEVPPFSALSNAQVFAEATSTIKVGTWITNIYMRQAVMVAATSLTIQEITGGRMMLGLGVSHKPVNTRYEIEMGDPVETMKDYVTQVKAFLDGTAQQLSLKRKQPPVPVYIAGLTKGAATLAGDLASGETGRGRGESDNDLRLNHHHDRRDEHQDKGSYQAVLGKCPQRSVLCFVLGGLLTVESPDKANHVLPLRRLASRLRLL